MATVSLQGLGKRYGEVAAVEDVSIEVADGELVALLGPSGCGKTTTLRLVAGFVEASAGRILLGDRDVTRAPPHRRNAGMVFQSFALFPHLSVARNVAYGLEMRRVPRGEIRARVDTMLARVQLGSLADRLPRQLSGGQQQRVALARALVISPDVLLLDEPLSALDAKLRHDVRAQIRSLQQSLRLSSIFVTHDQEEALGMADRLVLMNNGRIEQVGSPADLYERPRTPFVADFIGRTNFFPGRLEDGRFRTEAGFDLEVRPTDRAEASLLAIRPEQMGLWPEAAAPTDLRNRIPGTVELASYLGPHTEVRVRIAGDRTVIVTRPNASRSVGGGHATGEPVVLSAPPGSCLLF